MNRYKTRMLIREEDIGRRLVKPKVNEANIDNDYYGGNSQDDFGVGVDDDVDAFDQGGVDQDLPDEPGTELATPEDMPDMDGMGDAGGAGDMGLEPVNDDTSEMLGMIGYLQDMGMSMSNNHYDVDMLAGKDPEFIKRIYSKVAGDVSESRNNIDAVPGIAFVNTVRLAESVSAEQSSAPQADPDIVNMLARLNRR